MASDPPGRAATLRSGAGPDGRTSALWTLLHWVEGETLGRLPDEQEVGLIGAMLARLHRRARGWSPQPGFTRPVYDAAHFGAAARGLSARTGGLLDERTRRVLAAVLSDSTAVLARLGRDDDQVGLIHADVHGGNVVYAGEPRRVGLIDFARFGFGCWALDLAMAMHYLPDELHDPLVLAYRSGFALPPKAQRALPHLRFLAAIDNLAILSAIFEEAEYIPAELALVTAQAEQLAGGPSRRGPSARREHRRRRRSLVNRPPRIKTLVDCGILDERVPVDDDEPERFGRDGVVMGTPRPETRPALLYRARR